MATTANWEKTPAAEKLKNDAGGERIKFIIGGVLLLGAVLYLVFSGTMTGAQFFLTVDEVVNDSAYLGETVRISGAVLGDTIEYDSENLVIDFTIVQISTETDNLALELYTAVNDPSRTRVPVHVEGEVMPDLLQHEAQAILTGTMGEDGIFYADELLLKCPSRYEENLPGQAVTHAG